MTSLGQIPMRFRLRLVTTSCLSAQLRDEKPAERLTVPVLHAFTNSTLMFSQSMSQTGYATDDFVFGHGILVSGLRLRPGTANACNRRSADR